MAMQHGSESSIKCPHCKKEIAPPAVVKNVQHGQIVEVTGTCMRCGKENYFWARWSITVEAEKASLVK